MTAQQGIDTEAPSQLQNLCNLALIFEVRVNDYNLKEGSQNYTVTKTFVPTKVTEEQPILHSIKQEPKSPEIASSEEDDMPINRFKRKNCNQNQVAQSEEEISINQEKKESAQQRNTSTVTYKPTLNTTYQRKKEEATLIGRKKKKEGQTSKTNTNSIKKNK
ncbi:hypothetical protein PIB30_063178 [Stylosanthes scabra]|uniref:Uncharacterized protein n=1 Tax=Stylosanthes scabra TaxID=79078 RepID=A0ABU6RLN1_9FABA|nr:hypothetical protein [Stylosanthes scabra]